MADRYEEGGYFAFVLVCVDGSCWSHLSLAHSREEAESGRVRAYREHLEGLGRKVEAVHFVGSVEKSHAECQRLHERVDRRAEKLARMPEPAKPVVVDPPVPSTKTVLVGPGEALW